jgi:Holliday junction resolvasome RuvABC endonuclease subunit
VISVAGSAIAYVTCGCIRTGDADLPLRLGIILRDLAEVIAATVPTEVAVEKVFVNVNPQSTCCWDRRAARRFPPRSSPHCPSTNTRRCR